MRVVVLLYWCVVVLVCVSCGKFCYFVLRESGLLSPSNSLADGDEPDVAERLAALELVLEENPLDDNDIT